MIPSLSQMAWSIASTLLSWQPVLLMEPYEHMSILSLEIRQQIIPCPETNGPIAILYKAENTK